MPATHDTALAAIIDQQPQFLGDDWLRQQEARKREEAEFHDRDRAGHKDEEDEGETSPNRRFYVAKAGPASTINHFISNHAPGRTVLDYACGHGALAIQAAQVGASLTVGIDISAVSVRNATENASRAGVSERTRFLQRDCENTELPEQAFDIAICSGMLHHLDLPRAFPELHRLLKPGGRVICGEALSYNPVIQWYRNRTPELRTAWEKEHILNLDDLRLASHWFRVENIRYYNLVAPLAGFLPAGPLRATAARILGGADSILTRIPLLKYWSWVFTFELVRKP